MRRGAAAALLPLLGACASATTTGQIRPVPIFDGHNDLAIHYMRRGWAVDAFDFSVSLPGSSDLPRWRAAGVSGALVTIASDRGIGASDHFPRLLVALDWFDALVARHPRDLVRIGSSAELRRARERGLIGLVPAIEGGDQVDASLANLRAAYDRGVRSMTIVYDHHGPMGDGAMVFESSRAVARPPVGGLSPFGREVVREMNRMGMIVDVSHAAETTVRDVLRLSRAPVIFSHSGARALADTPRNVSDEVLRLLAANEGVVMIPFAPYLTTDAHWRWWSSGEARHAALVAAHPSDPAAVEAGMASWDRANPQPEVTIAQVADQIEHVARIAGHDHVGIGSDFDGMGSFAVRGLAHSGELQALLDELRRRGWSQSEIQALAFGNFERVFARVEQAAARGPAS